MRYKAMPTAATGTLTVPRLSGGLNLYDMPGQVGDHQLTQADNVWWYRGALRTRPGVCRREGLPTGTVTRVQSLNERELLVYHFDPSLDYADGSTFYVTLVRADGRVERLGGPDNGAVFDRSVKEPPHVLGVRAGAGQGFDWCFYVEDNGLYTYTVATQRWQKGETAAVPTVPLVLVNGRGNKATGEDVAVSPQAANRLTDRVRCAYTTDGVSTLYPLPQTGMVPYRATLTVWSGDTARTVEGEVDTFYGLVLFRDLTCSEAGLPTGTATRVNVSVYVDSAAGIFRAEAHRAGEQGAPLEGFVLPRAELSGNLMLWMLTTTDNEPWRRRGLRQAVWYGGLAAGAEGGIHLFTAGHPDEPNVLRWSEVNDPTYFPENNYATVGEDGAPITALAKQGELLVIFREHDIYCTQYVDGTTPSEEEMVQRRALEATVHAARFPLTQLHPGIGCDCPHTVRLVNNKLVWMTADGRVHILTGTSRFSERNVRQASPLIEQALQRHSREERLAAVAGEYRGHYLLVVGNRVYLLDCQTGAFNQFQNYSREETAQKSLPWYAWTLPEDTYRGVAYDGAGLVLLGNDTLYTLAGETDDGVPVTARFTTKQYGFDHPGTRKNVPRLYLELEDGTGCHLRIRYVTDRGIREDGYRPWGDGSTRQERTVRLTPHLQHIRHVAVQIETTGALALTGITLVYELKKGGMP